MVHPLQGTAPFEAVELQFGYTRSHNEAALPVVYQQELIAPQEHPTHIPLPSPGSRVESLPPVINFCADLFSTVPKLENFEYMICNLKLIKAASLKPQQFLATQPLLMCSTVVLFFSGTNREKYF